MLALQIWSSLWIWFLVDVHHKQTIYFYIYIYICVRVGEPFGLQRSHQCKMVGRVKSVPHVHIEDQEFQMNFQMMFIDDFCAEKRIIDPYIFGEFMLVERLIRE